MSESADKLVIFDNDGVLVDSEPIACQAVADLLSQQGLPTTFDDVVDHYLGGSITRTRGLAEARLGHPLSDDFEELFHRELFVRYPRELKPVHHVKAAIESIGMMAGVSTCVASSGTHERIRQSLTVVGLIDYFVGRIFSASDVENGKPAPDLFLHAAASMGFSPGQCLVVEDSPLGLQAASRAGMQSVGYAALQTPEELQAASIGVINDMSNLPEIVANLSG